MIPVLGIDPGVNGGLAVLNAKGDPVLITPFRPYWTHRDLAEAVAGGVGILRRETGRVAYVEKVGYFGRRRGSDGKEHHDGGKGAFTFGQVSGLIRGTIHALHVEVRDALPMTWQSRLGCLSGGDKNVTKARAQVLFPGLKITHNTADALLIARYGWECLSL